MANPFKEAEKRRKKSPGGESEQRTETDEVIPVTAETVSSEEKEPAAEVTVTETQPDPVPPAVPEAAAEEPAPVVVTDIKTFYQRSFGGMAMQEPVSVRKQFTITPSLEKKLKKAVKNREVKSANHLVNVLLELYFDGKLSLEEGQDNEAR